MVLTSKEVDANYNALEAKGFRGGGGDDYEDGGPAKPISRWLKRNFTVPGDGQQGGVGPVTYELSARVFTKFGHEYKLNANEGIEGWTTISASPQYSHPLPIDQSSLDEVAGQTDQVAQEESSKERKKAGIQDDITFKLGVPRPQFNEVELGGKNAVQVYQQTICYLMSLGPAQNHHL